MSWKITLPTEKLVDVGLMVGIRSIKEREFKRRINANEEIFSTINTRCKCTMANISSSTILTFDDNLTLDDAYWVGIQVEKLCEKYRSRSEY